MSEVTCACVGDTGKAKAGVNDVKPTTTAMVAALNAETILFMSVLSRFEWTLRFVQ